MIFCCETGVALDDDTIVTPEQMDQVTGFMTKVNGIREMLKRDRMKVVFFGR